MLQLSRSAIIRYKKKYKGREASLYSGACLLTYLIPYLLTYLPTYLPIYQFIFYLPTYLFMYLSTYLLAYLITHSMRHSPLEANWFSPSQEIPRILRNCVYKCLPPVPILSQINPIHASYPTS
jgi:hypothetical protein